jgi:hypothetical protein
MSGELTDAQAFADPNAPAPAATAAPSAAPAQPAIYESGDMAGQAAISPAMSAARDQMEKAGTWDQSADPGTAHRPFFDTGEGGHLPGGAYYVDQAGHTNQAPAEGLDLPATTATKAAPPVPGAPLTDAQAFADPNAPSPAAPPASPILQAARQVAAEAHPEDRAIENGVTFGFDPEVQGAEAYAATAIGNAISRLQGQAPTKYSAADAYSAVAQAEREQQNAFAAAHPIENTALNLTGSLANPLSIAGGEFVGAAPTVAGALGRGAVVGGSIGALNGAGDAGPGNRLQGALTGGASGVVLGGALGAGGKALIGALPKGAPGGASLASGVQSALDSAPEASGSPSALAAIKANVAAGGHPVDSAFRGMADTLPTPYPLSAGQASGDPAQLAAEAAMRSGKKGAGAQQTMQAFDASGAAAKDANIGQINDALTNGQPVEPNSSGQMISNKLNSMRDAANAKVDANYDAARAAPGIDMSAQGATAIPGGMRDAVSQLHTLSDVKPVANLIDQLQQDLSKSAGGSPTGQQSVMIGGKQSDLSQFPAAIQAQMRAAGGLPPEQPGPSGALEAIFGARRKLTTLSATSSDGTVRHAAGVAVGALDDATDNAVKNDLISGDTQGIQAWKDAVASRRDFGNLYEKDNLINTLTDRKDMGYDSSSPSTSANLKVAPQDAVNYILGRNGLATLADNDKGRDIALLGKTIGTDSPEWNAMKADIFNRSLNIKGGWAAAKANYGNVINQVFTPQEVNLIDRFAATSARAGQSGVAPVSGAPVGDAAKNIAVAVANHHIPFLGAITGALKDLGAAGQAKAATFGAALRPNPAMTPPNAFAGLGGAPATLGGVAAGNAARPSQQSVPAIP